MKKERKRALLLVLLPLLSVNLMSSATYEIQKTELMSAFKRAIQNFQERVRFHIRCMKGKCSEMEREQSRTELKRTAKIVVSTAFIVITAALAGVIVYRYKGKLLSSKMPDTQFVQKFNITNNTDLILEKGDITKANVEAIVNAANEQLYSGGGVCGAIFDAAGQAELQAGCNLYKAGKDNVRCRTGSAVITPSFGLESQGIRYIIHAVGPDCRKINDANVQDSLLEQAYNNALALADHHGIQSVAFPFISSAIYAFPKARAARIALKTVIDYIKGSNNSGITAVHFSLFSRDDFDLFKETIKKMI